MARRSRTYREPAPGVIRRAPSEADSSGR